VRELKDMIRTEVMFARTEIQKRGMKLVIMRIERRSQPIILLPISAARDLFKFSHIYTDSQGDNMPRPKAVVILLTMSLGLGVRINSTPPGCFLSSSWATAWAHVTVAKETKP
jgi:hypothetical protein